MRLNVDNHGHACDCGAHRAKAAKVSNAALWSALLPVLACAFCPVCVTTYTKLFSVLGVGFGLSEMQHVVLLLVAVSASVGVSAWRSWRARRIWPITVALAGSTLVVIGHLSGELHALEWTGVLVQLAGGLTEHFRLRRAAGAQQPART